MILLDTNILIHANQPASPHYATITGKLKEFARDKQELMICPQVLYEYYVAVTRPLTQNGYGLSSEEAMEQINIFKNAYTFIDDSENVFTAWVSIIHKYKTIGKPAHDARLVAIMQVWAIHHIYTMNPGDFNRYADIIIILN